MEDLGETEEETPLDTADVEEALKQALSM